MVAITPRPASLTSLIDLPPHLHLPSAESLHSALPSPDSTARRRMVGLLRRQAAVNHICRSMWKLSALCYEFNNHFHPHAVLPLPLSPFLPLPLLVHRRIGGRPTGGTAALCFPPSELSVVLKVKTSPILLLQKRRKREKHEQDLRNAREKKREAGGEESRGQDLKRWKGEEG